MISISKVPVVCKNCQKKSECSKKIVVVCDILWEDLWEAFDKDDLDFNSKITSLLPSTKVVKSTREQMFNIA